MTCRPVVEVRYRVNQHRRWPLGKGVLPHSQEPPSFNVQILGSGEQTLKEHNFMRTVPEIARINNPLWFVPFSLLPQSCRFLLALTVALAVILTGAAPSHAGLIMQVQNSIAPVGGIGSFDVTHRRPSSLAHYKTISAKC